MTTVLLLIRHASNDFVGRALAGRLPGVQLNAQGRTEAQRLAERLGHTALAAIYTSPLERALETAAPLAASLKLTPQPCPELHEIECGDWTGRSFSELDGEPEWRVWVERRSEARPPKGESIVEAQRRVVGLIERLTAQHEGESVALVSHSDVIKAALAHVLGLSLDHLERFEIAPASVSAVVAGPGWAQVRRVNDTGTLDRF